MTRRKGIIATSLLLLVVLISVGCGQEKNVPTVKKDDAIANNESSETEISNSESKKEKLKTTFEDLEDGMWNGDIGYVGFHPGGGGMLGIIIFHDSHDGAIFHFTDVKENETALEFEIDPSMAVGTEHLTPFSIYVQKVGNSTIELSYQNYVYTLDKTSKEEFQDKYVHDAYYGEKEIEAEEEQVYYLQEELNELSDSKIQIGTLHNNYDYTNSIQTYFDYIGNEDSVEEVRSAILEKTVEMNKIADKYLWINMFSINVYLNNGVPGETEKDKQTNGLTNDRVNNQENRAFFIATYPEDRWILSKKEVSTDELPGYIPTFASWGEFSNEKDKDLNMEYPLYNAEKMNSYSVLEQASKGGITNRKTQDKIDENNESLNSTKIKEILGYWHYQAMNQYYEITFDEFGGMIKNSTGSGNSFTIKNEAEDGIEIALATGETWIVKRDGDQLLVSKDNGYDMVLNLSSKDKVE